MPEINWFQVTARPEAGPGTFAQLPEGFFQRIKPTPVRAPKPIQINQALAKELGLNLDGVSDEELARIFSGNEILPNAEPIALAYAGHQFGHFVPQLGDGRAILLGEVIDAGGIRRDIQLKGAGQTKFSRRGDGRAALGPVMREYIVSEAMHAFGIPTTRSLAIVATGESVFREQELPGAILTRVALSHIRIGTFEYFAARQDLENLKILADYVIDRHFPEVRDTKNPYQSLFTKIIERQAKLISQWMQIGFIHGVMNTDNVAVSGETLDYGPCAFLDEYNPDAVFSSIDQFGRYAFGNQPQIAQWNLRSLAACLSALFESSAQRLGEFIEAEIASFQVQFKNHWCEGMAGKLGLAKFTTPDLDLIQDFLALMTKNQADYTLSFRFLSDAADHARAPGKLRELFSDKEGLEAWLEKWRSRLQLENKSPSEIATNMRQVNPAFIPRNHRIEQAIAAAVTNNDFTKMQRLLGILAKPFTDQPENAEFMRPPRPDERVLETFCGT